MNTINYEVIQESYETAIVETTRPANPVLDIYSTKVEATIAAVKYLDRLMHKIKLRKQEIQKMKNIKK